MCFKSNQKGIKWETEDQENSERIISRRDKFHPVGFCLVMLASVLLMSFDLFVTKRQGIVLGSSHTSSTGFTEGAGVL